MTINPETGLYGSYGFIYEPFWKKSPFVITVLCIGLLFSIALFFFLLTHTKAGSGIAKKMH